MTSSVSPGQRVRGLPQAGDIWLAVIGVAAFLATFLPWWSISYGPVEVIGPPANPGGSLSLNAWDQLSDSSRASYFYGLTINGPIAWGAMGLLLLLGAVAVLHGLSGYPAGKSVVFQAGVFAGAVSVIMVLVKLINYHHPVNVGMTQTSQSPGAGLFIGLLLAIAAVTTCVLSIRKNLGARSGPARASSGE
jgi:hypothetical protein